MSVIEAPAQTIVQPVTRADVLHRAADLLEEFGWTQCDYGPVRGGLGPFCATGAIWRAERDLAFKRGGESLIHSPLWGIPGSLTVWNDEQGRTKAEVVARLRAAAEAS